MSACKDSMLKSIRHCLDIKVLTNQQPQPGKGGPGRAAMPATGNTAAFRATLWTSMEKLMDSLYSSCAQVCILICVPLIQKFF